MIKTSLILFCYMQADTVERAACAALAQICEPIEIILSDDFSTDGTFEIIKDIAERYNGPHRVRARQNLQNLGVGGHLLAAVADCTGELIVAAAGDDVSEPGRCDALIRERERHSGKPLYMYSNVTPIHRDGSLAKWNEEKVYRGQHTLDKMAAGFISALGGSAAYTRDLFTQFEPFAKDVWHEDRVLPFRAVLLGGLVIYVDQPLVRYSVEGGVSRHKPTSKQDYLTRYTYRQNIKTLPDARQRLADAIYTNSSKAIKNECCRTIVDQQYLINISQAKGIRVELFLIDGLLRKARFVPLIRHYIKLRTPFGRRIF